MQDVFLHQYSWWSSGCLVGSVSEPHPNWSHSSRAMQTIKNKHLSPTYQESQRHIYLSIQKTIENQRFIQRWDETPSRPQERLIQHHPTVFFCVCFSPSLCVFCWFKRPKRRSSWRLVVRSCSSRRPILAPWHIAVLDGLWVDTFWEESLRRLETRLGFKSRRTMCLTTLLFSNISSIMS